MKNAAHKKLPLLAGVVGWPVAQSMSPLIHTIWAARANIDGYYIPVAVPPSYDDFARVMDSLKTVGFAGVNVTMPHKDHALRYADIASDAARTVGAANMLTFNTDSGVMAANSDATGFRHMLLDAKANPKKALVLGAGGAARAVLWALNQKPLTCEITVTNRTKERAEQCAAIANTQTLDWNDKSDALGAFDLVVNTTSLGMSGQPPLALDLANLKPGALVVDIVYSPLETELLKAAKSRGNPTADGLSMLMHQAAPGFLEWFGGDANLDARVDDELRSALLHERERRARQ